MENTPSSPDPLHGLNPESLMAAASMPTDADANTVPLKHADLPTLDEIAAAFPDLEIVGLIGHGGMSAVFKARQPKLDRVVALKVLPKSLAATPGFAERFNREGRVLARLNHPHIVAVHDFGESGGFAYLIMEFVDGVNLRQAMRAGRFTPEQALNIIPAICDALQFAHTQGVLHRDIKPENILLDSKGKVKIADFGIAKILDEKGGDMLLTQSGAKLGTAPYMAPEQIEQPASVDHRADIYSLGVVFYEMLTGELPLGRFAAPSELSSVGGNIDEIVFRALEKERARRQQSVNEFKTQVEGASSVGSSRATANYWTSFEYKSNRTLFGMPLLHVVQGNDPATGRMREARGFFAFGGRARGIFAFGGIARGWFAFGGVAIGGFACGGLGIGLVSFAGLAIALLLSIGGVGLGTLATGGLAAGWHAHGGVALGWHAFGGLVFAHQGLGGTVHATEVMKSISEMPWLTQSLARIMAYSSVMGLMWLPLSLVSVVAPWWARRQLEAESRKVDPPGKGVFWTVPAVVLLCAVLWWLLYRWTTVGSEEITLFIIPTVVSCMGLLFFALSLPLWLRIVPINPLYGVRLPSTMASNVRWFNVNAHFGKHLFCWSLLVVGAGVAGFYQLPRHQDAYAWAAITLTLVALAAAVVSTIVWMHRHPMGKAPRKPHWLLRNLELVLPVVVLMFFVRSFIGRPYVVPNGAEHGVAKNSRWIATHLNTGFAPGDLIAYEHDSGQTWLARVVVVESKGLRLKRGASPDEFFMPWDKIVGKMLFSYLSPAVSNADSSSASVKRQPVIEGSTKALERRPQLRFTRVKRNGAGWSWPVFAPNGEAVAETESRQMIAASVGSDLQSQDGEDCWLQLWFEHPDFDRHSLLGVEITLPDGRPLVDRSHNIAGAGWGSDKPEPPLQSMALSPGRHGHLPHEVRVVLRYGIGRWKTLATVPADYRGAMTLGDQCHLSAIGEGVDHEAFIAWSKKQDDVCHDAVVMLKDGAKLGSLGGLQAGGGGDLVQRISFPRPLTEVAAFEVRTRTIRTVVFDHVVIPPLP